MATTLTVAAVAAGSALAVERHRSRPRTSAVLDGMAIELQRATWVGHEMREPNGFAMPQAMMSGMPEPGLERLHVSISLHNQSRRVLRFGADELVIEAAPTPGERGDPKGDRIVPVTTDTPEVTLRPGEVLHASAAFDVPARAPRARLEWLRSGGRVTLLATRPPEHQRGEAPRTAAWPATAAQLPAGDAGRGAALFAGRHGCTSCHGGLAIGTNTVGPPLSALVSSSSRSSAEHADRVYESLRFPDRRIASACARGEPCATPSVMPAYGDVLSLQEMADLVTYLAHPRATAAPMEQQP